MGVPLARLGEGEEVASQVHLEMEGVEGAFLLALVEGEGAEVVAFPFAQEGEVEEEARAFPHALVVGELVVVLPLELAL